MRQPGTAPPPESTVARQSTGSQMSQGLIPTDASPSSESRFPPAPPSLQAQGSAPFGFYGVPLAFQPTPQGTGARQSQDMPKRRVSEARRQRTPMSCDRCKVRKIKVYLASVSSLTFLVYQSHSWPMWLLHSHEVSLSNYCATKTSAAVFYFG